MVPIFSAAGQEEPVPIFEAIENKITNAAHRGDATQLPNLLDQAAAIDLSRTLDIASRHTVDGAVIAGSWRPSPAEARKLFPTIAGAPHSSYRDHLLLGMVNTWVKTTPEDAEKSVASVKDESLRSYLRDNLKLSLLHFQPARALQNAITHYRQPHAIKVKDAANALAKADLPAATEALKTIPKKLSAARTTLVTSIAATWSKRDLAAASSWARALTNEAEKSVAYEEIAYVWSKTDTSGAGKWVTGLPPSPPRDAATRALVFHSSAREPEKAFAWAQLIGDIPLRQTCLATALIAWTSSDREAATAALEASDISGATKKTLLEFTRPSAD